MILTLTLIILKVDYFKSLYMGITLNMIQKLQLMENVISSETYICHFILAPIGSTLVSNRVLDQSSVF